MSSPLTIPGYGRVDHRQIIKEDLIALWEEVTKHTGVAEYIRTRHPFLDAEASDRFFEVKTPRATYKSARIVLAIGRRGIPRKLGIPGEDEGSNVSYSLLEPERYSNDRLVVVGGGDSAIEAALSLAEQPGNTVRLSYRKERFSRLKPDNQERIERAISSGNVEFLPATNLAEIRPQSVLLREETGSSSELPNDYVFIFAGGTMPTTLLTKLGIEIDRKFAEKPY
jgi:thioredoxin reductase